MAPFPADKIVVNMLFGTEKRSDYKKEDVKDVVKAGFGLTSSGTYTYTWSLTQQFTGPPAPYNSRDYYGAINYELYSVYVKRYDVYRVYNGNAMTGNNTYYQGLTTVNGVKIPKAVQYSVDSIQ